MAATVTQTMNPRTYSLLLHLREEGLDALLDELLDLLEENQDLEDPLSLALLQWGEELAELFMKDVSLEELAGKLYQLRKIALNPLDHSPLDNPRIAGGRVWEEWVLLQVKALFQDISCYSDEASLADVEEHPLAEAILRWQDRVLSSRERQLLGLCEELERLQSLEDRSGWLEKDRPLRVVDCIKLAASAEEVESQQALLAKIEKERERFQKIAKKSSERKKATIESTRVALEEDEKRLAEDLTKIRNTYTRTIQSLREGLATVQKDHVLLKARVAAAEGKIVPLDQRVSSLEARVAEAEAQNRANWEAAHSGGGGGGCIIM